ncbi:hypothetical protein B7P43_G03654 [Cryptotermes secundus]|uniref:Uncharacterized protein n=1 Tax=Cryptotermes secundus TaxID=105785 RepID=A0A2J7Q3P3_9NEOP|nr:hypothetical protein B7P43_G03654 [Cryptotermes secundus]
MFCCSYTVSVGVVDKLALYCGGVRDPIDGDPQAGQFLLSCLELLTTLAARSFCLSRCSGSVRRGGRNDDPTQLIGTLQMTELVGAVSMLYGMLLHQGAPPRGSASPPPALPSHTIAVTIATIRLLNRVAELDLLMFQSVLGAEGISLQFRHIASYLLWYCSYDKEKELLHEVVRVVGFFAVRNQENQNDQVKKDEVAGHVARIGEIKNAYRILVGKPEGTRRLGRPRRRWVDNIKMDLREIGWDGMNWIDLAQDKGQWGALVNTVMNLRVP